MEYTLLSEEEQVEGLRNRIYQLEQEHYQNVLLVEECDIVGDTVNRPKYLAGVASAELRIQKLREKLAAREPQDEREDND